MRNTKYAIKNLTSNQPFDFYQLNLTEDEWRTFEQVKIEIDNNSEKPYREKHIFGEAENVQQEAKTFIENLSSVNIGIAEKVAQLISGIVNEILMASGKETAWVVLRGWRPTEMFDIPRWHRDVPVLDKQGLYKFTIALKGPTMLFVRLTDDQKDLYFEIARELSWIMTQYASEDEHLERRKELAKLIIQTPPRNMAIFETVYDGAVHAEPPIHEERLFLSVFPESRQEIDKVAEAFREFKKSGNTFF